MIIDHREEGEFGEGTRTRMPDIPQGDRVTVKTKTHFSEREEFLALSFPRAFAEELMKQYRLTVWVVLAPEKDQDVRHRAESLSMSAEYSSKYQGWVIQL